MGALQGVPELIAAAKANAKTYEDRISEVLELANGQNASDAQLEELRVETVALKLAAIDIFSLFEARMQHHFRRGPFSQKLKSLLLKSEQTDLADRVHQYYLAVNVLKHGKGASYRELLNAPSSLFCIKSTEGIIANVEDAPADLLDISVPGFFDGLTSTILEAYRFLENRQVS
ncbi:MAG: hypothetical protein ACI8TF_002740 [Paracoccaceae bacterium]|jgi:hypothetical protein